MKYTANHNETRDKFSSNKICPYQLNSSFQGVGVGINLDELKDSLRFEF